MNKKLNYLSAIPLYGTCIMLFYLYFLCFKGRISKKKFSKVFLICAIVAAVCWYMISLILFMINQNFHSPVLYNYGILITLVVAGYIMNAFTFTFINKKWEYLSSIENDKISFFAANKKTIFYIALALSFVIIIISFVVMAMFGLI